ncbi:TIGR03084 family metal-binding protein [Geodermatophilus sp. SYSU D01119]
MRERLLADLAAESAALEDVLVRLSAADWARPTPASGWTVAAQVAHLAWTDELAEQAATDPAGFVQGPARARPESLPHAVDRAAREGAALPPAALLARWRAGRDRLAAALAAVPGGVALPWFGPPMGVASMVTARLMETWAHGTDVRDALGLAPLTSRRLDHVAHLGVRTRGFAFAAHGLPVPSAPIRVELDRADGTAWSEGPPDAEQRVTGPLLDFCLRVVQRRRRSQLALTTVGPDADAWLDVAQAFAGPPGPGSELARRGTATGDGPG